MAIEWGEVICDAEFDVGTSSVHYKETAVHVEYWCKKPRYRVNWSIRINGVIVRHGHAHTADGAKEVIRAYVKELSDAALMMLGEEPRDGD